MRNSRRPRQPPTEAYVSADGKGSGEKEHLALHGRIEAVSRTYGGRCARTPGLLCYNTCMSQPDRYPIPAATTRTELLVVNSRFIGSAAYTPTVSAARDFIAHVRTEIADATHHAYGYLVGFGGSQNAGMSDAGEPPGTAGRPILTVVRGSGLGDITVVVTRFFGGTLLGTGGLVHAYGDTAKAVLAITPRTERIETRTMLIAVGYADYATIRRILAAHHATLTSEEFAATITLTITLPAAEVGVCSAALNNATAGQVTYVVSE